MRARIRYIAAVVAALVMGAGLVSEGAGQGPATAPLAPGEILARTQNGCSAVETIAEGAQETEESIRARFAQATWTGACEHGLLSGRGELRGLPAEAGLPPDWRRLYTYYFGRRLEGNAHVHIPMLGVGESISTSIGGRSIERANAEGAPLWGYNALQFGVSPEPATSLRAPDGVSVGTYKTTCELHRAAVSGCTGDRPVYGVLVLDNDFSTPDPIQWCPNPYTSVGCAPLWEAVAAPYIQAQRAFLAKIDAANRPRKEEIDRLNAPYLAQLATAARAAEAARIAAKEKEERAFATSLTTLGVGQLFAKADELDQAGEADKARQVRRALVSRFPNSPLAAQAAAQMSGGAPAAAASSIPAPPSRPTPQTTAGARIDFARAVDAARAECSAPIAARRAFAYGPESEILTESWLLSEIRTYVRLSSPELIARGRISAERDRVSLARNPAKVREAQVEADMRNCFLDSGAAQWARAGASSTPSTTKQNPPLTTAPTSGATGCATTPQQSFRNFEAEFGAFSRANRNCLQNGTPSCPGMRSSGTRDQYQYSYFLGTRGLAILETYRQCLSSADFTANSNALAGMRDQGLRGCQQTSADGGASCTPTYPQNWIQR